MRSQSEEADMTKPVLKQSLQPKSAPGPSTPRWLDLARRQIGVHEGDGVHSNPTVIKFFIEAGHAEVKNDHTTPWCAAFVGAMLHESGITPTGTLWALDYAKWGQRIDGPAIGAIATKKRLGGGHVFFVAAFDASHVWALGGNQNDRVGIERIPRSAIYSYTWPPGEPLPAKAASGGTREGGVSGARED
jgi:uncharacterized protein (TIGR02594 family)